MTLVAPAVAVAHEQGPPVWSGLDMREHAGPLPAVPGALVAASELDASLWLPGTGEAYRYAYTTPDQQGRMALSTAAVLTPRGTPPPGGWSVIAFAHGTVGLGDDCTPSALTWHDDIAAYLDGWLRSGYALVITDYQGLGTPGLHSYLNGRVEAASVVHAVASAHELDIDLAPQWLVMGHSQGGQAALFTGNQVSALDPGSKMDFRGTVAIAPGVKVEVLALAMDPFVAVPLPQGLMSYAVMLATAVRDTSPEVPLNDHLTELGRALIDSAETVCGSQLWYDVEGMRPGDLFTTPWRDIPGFMEAVRSMAEVPVRGYGHPVLLVQGGLDIDVPAPVVLVFAAELDAAGEPVDLEVYAEADHRDILEHSLPEVRGFVEQVLSG